MSEDLIKIHVTFPHYKKVGGPAGEYLWGKRTDKPDCFKVNNLPFYAYGINFGDIVRCTPMDAGRPDGIESVEIVEVVEAADVTGFRVVFVTEKEDEIRGVAGGLTDKFGAKWERANLILWSAAVSDDNAELFFEELARLHEIGMLHFETCEKADEESFGLPADAIDDESDERAGSDD